jgi:hypothetical protein
MQDLTYQHENWSQMMKKIIKQHKQKLMLNSGNHPSTAICSLAVVCLLLFIPQQSDAAQWQIRVGKGRPLCNALQTSLSRGTYFDDVVKNDGNCTWMLGLATRTLEEPPWQDLDINQHRQLLKNLLVYRKFDAEIGSLSQEQEADINREIDSFIATGGRIQLWKTRLITYFYSQDPPKSSDLWQLQNIVQLRFKYGLTPERATGRACPVDNNAGWIGKLFVVNKDLIDIHPQIGRAGKILLNNTLMISAGQPVLLSTEGGVVITAERKSVVGFDTFCEVFLQIK